MAKISNLTELTTATDDSVLVINDGTPTTKKITVANLKSSLGLPSRVLYANLNQSGTDAPTMTVIKNTLGYEPTFLYDGVGDYTMMFDEAISASNAILTAGFTQFPYITAIRLSGGGIKIDTYNRSSGTADGVLVNASIKLEIYE
jgi:hypothetical protein